MDISILVPVYNVEQWLQRCVDSVLAQDYQDWELVLVDDGSTDDSPALCDAYATRDSRIIVVHKKNGGLPSARKAGFEASHGRYIVFLDSDDWLLPGALTTLHTAINHGNYDIVRARNWRVLVDSKRVLEQPRIATGELTGSEQFFRAMINGDMSPYLWGAIYRRSLFTADIFAALLPLAVGEDWATNLSIASRVKRVLLLPDVVCCYFINPQSMMQQRRTSREYAAMVEKIILEQTAHMPPYAHELIIENRVAGCINGFFSPELGFSTADYNRVIAYIADKNRRESVKAIVDSRRFRFIDSPVLFRIYTAAYRLAFFVIKQKGRKRKLIMPPSSI